MLTRVAKTPSAGAADIPSARIRGRQRFMVSDLPFPGGKTQYWRKYFIPPLIAWAGSQSDPFGTNIGVGSEAAIVWKQVFPALTLDQQDREILTGVVCFFSSSSFSRDRR